MAKFKILTAGQTQATKHYLSSIRRSMNRLDEIDFDHYCLMLKDIRLIRYILAKAFVEKRYIPELAAEILLKGLKSDRTFQDYLENDMELSISTVTAMNLRTRKRMTDKKERDTGHSHFTAT